MTRATYEFFPYGWSTLSPVPVGEGGVVRAGRQAAWVNTAQGYGLYADRGFRLKTTLSSVTNKSAAGFTHRHTDGKSYEWFAVDADLIAWNGSSWSSLSGSLTPAFAPGHYMIDGWSGWFNGTNSQAKLIRKASTWLEAVGHDMAAPTLAAPTTPSGGSFTAGTYQVRVAWVDSDGVETVFSAPSNVQAVTAASNDQVTVAEPGSAPSRAVSLRIAFTAVGESDTPGNYLYWEDVGKGFSSKSYSSLPTVQTTQAFQDINNIYRQAVIPIDNVDIAWEHHGRLFVASTQGRKIAWSEVGNPNHWYTDQVLDVGGDTDIVGVIRGGVSVAGQNLVFTEESIHVILGDLVRADIALGDTLATQVINVDAQPLFQGLGTVSHSSIVSRGTTIFFWSNEGPAVYDVGTAPQLIEPEHLRHGVSCIDTTYNDRIVGAIDPDLHMVCWTVPRKTNSSREMDGAGTAGICDQIWRYDYQHRIMSPPIELEVVHLSRRAMPSTQGTTDSRHRLSAMGPHGGVIEMNRSWGGGVGDSDDTDYDGLLATATTTTTADVTLSGITDSDLIGKTVTLYYPTDDDNFPGVTVQRTISGNTTSGSTLTITWQGALTVPSGTEWTVRIGGLRRDFDAMPDGYLPSGTRFRATDADHTPFDVVGQESVS